MTSGQLALLHPISHPPHQLCICFKKGLAFRVLAKVGDQALGSREGLGSVLALWGGWG